MLSHAACPSWGAPQRFTTRVANSLERLLRDALVTPARVRHRSACSILARVAVLACATLSCASTAKAVEHTLPSSTLVERCRGLAGAPPGAEGPLCESYLQGYLAGARSGGWLSIYEDGKPQETFSERAWRTRLGMSTRAPKPQSCLPDGTTLADIATALIAYAERRPTLENVSAQQLLEGMLRTSFPCVRAQK
ncbi:MAG: hypothetical protein IPJ97_03880 [Proteobacteria bacterium]|nr:hypothetical protein [Pseudomonadota bacterium]